MKILSGLKGTASAFAGQALEGLAIKRAARKWGIFVKPAPKQSKFWQRASSVVGNDVTSMFTDGPQMLIGAAHVETLSITHKATISTAPQEDGAFASYDKVQAPSQFTIRMTCDGSDTGNLWENMLPGFVRSLIGDGKDSPDALKKAFIETLDKAMASTQTYWVSTPEKLYSDINITGYTIKRGPDGTSDVLVADIDLQEVRKTSAKGNLKGKYPQGDPKQDNGTVQPTPNASAGGKA